MDPAESEPKGGLSANDFHLVLGVGFAVLILAVITVLFLDTQNDGDITPIIIPLLGLFGAFMAGLVAILNKLERITHAVNGELEDRMRRLIREELDRFTSPPQL